MVALIWQPKEIKVCITQISLITMKNSFSNKKAKQMEINAHSSPRNA